MVHGVGMLGGGREERWTVRRKWVEDGEREKDTRQSGPSYLSLYLAHDYIRTMKINLKTVRHDKCSYDNSLPSHSALSSLP